MTEKIKRTLENIVAGSFAVVLAFLLGYKGVQELELRHCRNKAEEKICKLAEKYEIPKPEVSIDKSRGKYGTYFDHGRISLSSDTILNDTPVDEWYFAGVHEFGHHKYWLNADKEKLQRFYYKSFVFKINHTFKEGLLEEVPDEFGHPNDDPSELYASAFLIQECGLIDKYKEKYFPEFTNEQKQLAEEIFGLVRK